MDKQHPSFILDIDASLVNTLQTHLKRYLLRNDVLIQKSAFKVIQAWGPTVSKLWGNYLPEQGRKLPHGSLVPRQGFVDCGCQDMRHTELGIRFLSSSQACNLVFFSKKKKKIVYTIK